MHTKYKLNQINKWLLSEIIIMVEEITRQEKKLKSNGDRSKICSTYQRR